MNVAILTQIVRGCIPNAHDWPEGESKSVIVTFPGDQTCAEFWARPNLDGMWHDEVQAHPVHRGAEAVSISFYFAGQRHCLSLMRADVFPA